MAYLKCKRLTDNLACNSSFQEQLAIEEIIISEKSTYQCGGAGGKHWGLKAGKSGNWWQRPLSWFILERRKEAEGSGVALAG